MRGAAESVSIEQAVLSADLNTVFDPLQQAQKVAQMTLNVLLDNIQLAAEEGKNDLEIVLKAVEFATPVDGLPASALDTAETAKDHLSYAIPTGVVGNNIVLGMGQYFEGLLGKIADNVTIAGSIGGSITGNVSTPAVLDNKFTPPAVSWRIQDANPDAVQRLRIHKSESSGSIHNLDSAESLIDMIGFLTKRVH